MLRLIEQARAKALCHAAGDTDDATGRHVPLQLAESTNHTLLGMVANRAGVEQDDVGAIRYVDRVIACGGQLAEHELSVADVHLAAVGFDEDGGTR